MKKLLQTLLLLPLFVLGACGGGADGESGPTKPINSFWTAVSNNYGGALINMDLTRIIPGKEFTITLGNCSATVEVNGNEYAGFYRESGWSGCGDLQGLTFVSGAYAVDKNNKLHIVLSSSNFGLLPTGDELISIYR